MNFPGFWTVLKWAVAITLAPILVWLAFVLIIAATVIINRDDHPPAKAPPAAARRR